MRKSVQKSPEPTSAVSTPGKHQTKLRGRLATARGIPEHARQGKTSLYDINVRPDGSHFRLYNRNEPCGDRLVKGMGNKKEPNPFPLVATECPAPPWSSACWLYDTLEAAEIAANLLQDYLDLYENPELGPELRRYAKQHPDEAFL